VTLCCVVHYDIVWSVAFHASDADIFASCSQVCLMSLSSVNDSSVDVAANSMVMVT